MSGKAQSVTRLIYEQIAKLLNHRFKQQDEMAEANGRVRSGWARMVLGYESRWWL